MTQVPITPQLAFIESPMQLLLIFLIVFILFGAKKMPTMAKDIGKGIREFKKSLAGESDDDEGEKLLDKVTCSKCGTVSKQGIKYCSECGSKLAS